ncbi:MAG: MFS transporter [Eubacterium sp.]
MQKEQTFRKYLTLFALCLTGAVVYELPYLSYGYYDLMLEAFSITNTQMGTLMSAYGLVAMLAYFPGGWIADRFPAKILMMISLVSTGLLGIWISTFPPYPVLLTIYILWGLSITLPFWAAMLKATRQLGDSSEQGRLFGILEAGRGLFPVFYGLIIVWIFNQLGAALGAMRGVFIAYSVLCFFGALITFFFIKYEKESAGEAQKGASGKEVLQILKMPGMWLVAFVIFSSYNLYTCFSYLTPYMTEFFGLSDSMGATLYLIRFYAIGVAGGIASGFIADKTGSNARVIAIVFLVALVGLIGFFVIPTGEAYLMLIIAALLVVAIGIFMSRGIYFATIDELNIPMHLTGAAIGFASVIGFMPEAFVYTLVGYWLDTYPGVQGYKIVFSYMLVFSIIGAIAAFALYLRVKKQKKTEFIGEK